MTEAHERLVTMMQLGMTTEDPHKHCRFISCGKIHCPIDVREAERLYLRPINPNPVSSIAKDKRK